MNILRLLTFVLLFLLLGQDARSQDSIPPDAILNPETTCPRFLDRSGIQILSATYGSGTTFADVTDETIKLLNQQPRFYAHPEWLRVDPTPGWNKALLVVFTYQKHRYIFSCGEGGEVRLPLLQRVVAEQTAACP